MRRITASRTSLALACTYWTREDVPHDDKPGPSAKAGQAFHAAVEESLLVGRTDVARVAKAHALPPAATKKLGAQVRQWESWWTVERPEGAELLPEIAYAYDPQTETARTLVKKHHRDYSNAKPGEITGSADLVVVKASGDLEVWDWKSGAGWVEPPAQNAQLATLALSAARVLGVRTARVAVVRCSDVEVRRFAADLYGLDLDAHADRLARVADEVEAGGSEPKGGEHCRWCPARRACPGYVEPKESAA